MIEPPAPSEYAPFYAGYVSEIASEDVIDLLDRQREEVGALARGVPEERETWRYAPGKWSVREVFGHLGDAERVFGYRALCFSRGDETPLPGFDENRYVAASGSDRRPLAELAQELVALRTANLGLFRGLEADAWELSGVANGAPVSVRALAFILAGHLRHHLSILRERYGIHSG